MNVRDLSIVLRPRSSWEAVDLGTGLAKRYYRDLFRMGLVGFGPVFLVLALLCWKLPLLLPVLIWWFKPAYDRFYLHYLSRRIFGQEVTVGETWGEWRRLLFKGTFSLLTWRRFLVNRSMVLAVSDLENLSGSARGARCGVLSRVGGGTAFLITWGGLFIEFLGLMTISVLVGFFIPQGQGVEWDAMMVWFGNGGVGLTLLILFFGLFYGMLVVLWEPFYLASGFALYLNSRTSQEGWDIELRFRELAARVAQTRVNVGNINEEGGKSRKSGGAAFASSKSSGVLGLFLLVGACFLASSLKAEDGSEPQEVIHEVLAHEDFANHVEKYKEWVPNENSWLERFGEWLEGVGVPQSLDGGAGAAMGVLFQLVGILALCLLGVVLVVLMVNLFRARSLRVGPGEKIFKRLPPQVLMGMEVTPESLPDNLLGQARHYWGAGQTHLAMSLLYRGALTKLITEQEVPIEGSNTELECVAQVESAAPANLAAYFQLLSLQWMKAAYSKEEVEPESFERLCATWPFEGRAE
ncbi:MAG: hypothetical protein ACSHYB_01250 [Roseibacillus sp.]